jgi:hypothetical protein
MEQEQRRVTLEEPAGEPVVRRAWEWDGELSSAEREELVALRTEVAELHDRITALQADAKRAERRERDLRGALKWLASTGWTKRRMVLRELRATKLI